MEIAIEKIESYLSSLSEKEKDKLLRQLLKKDKTLVEKPYFKHIAEPEELDARYDEYEEKMKSVLFASYRERADELKVAKAIGESKKVITEFTKIDTRAIKEAELLMVILSVVFEDRTNPAMFGTCWTKYDFAVTQTLKRIITLLNNKIHEDHKLDFKDKLEKYIMRLKSTSSFNDFVYDLPDKI